MAKAKVDQFLLTRHDAPGNLQGIVIVKVDGTLEIGKEGCINEEEQARSAFSSKPRQMRTEEAQRCNWISI